MDKKKQSPAEHEKELEREGQTVLPTMPKRSERGGAREGAGRPRLDPNGEQRGKHSLYCTKSELLAARDFLKQLRANQNTEEEAEEEEEEEISPESLKYRDGELYDMLELVRIKNILEYHHITLSEYYQSKIFEKLEQLDSNVESIYHVLYGDR